MAAGTSFRLRLRSPTGGRPAELDADPGGDLGHVDWLDGVDLQYRAAQLERPDAAGQGRPHLRGEQVVDMTGVACGGPGREPALELGGRAVAEHLDQVGFQSP